MRCTEQEKRERETGVAPSGHLRLERRKALEKGHRAVGSDIVLGPR